MRIAVICLCIAAMLLFSGCVTPPSEQLTTYTIGIIAPLTGNFALQGERIRNGMELAREDVLRAENISLVMVFEDACLPKDTVPAARKLIEADHVALIGGSFCLIGFASVIPIAEEQGIIAFNTAANPDITLNHSLIFSTNIAIRDDARKLAMFAREQLNASRAAALYYVTPLGQDYGKYFAQYFEEFGGTMVSNEQVDLQATDFRGELTKIKAQEPDVIFVAHLARSLGIFLMQARELGIDATILSHSEAEDPNVLETAGSAAEGFVISSSEPAEKTPVMQAFEVRYQKRFGALPDVLAANAYDALRLQGAALKTCGQNTTCLQNEFHGVANYSGVSGMITIGADGSSAKPSIMKIVRNGTFVRYP